LEKKGMEFFSKLQTFWEPSPLGLVDWTSAAIG
jgi:hypothetical protein